MLFDAANTRAVARALKAHYSKTESTPPLVVDPVCVSTSGHTLLAPEAVQVVIDELCPLAALITPNKAEAELLLSQKRGATVNISSLEDMISSAESLLALGCKAVLLKGGHVELTLSDVEKLAAALQDVVVVREELLLDNMEILQVNERDLSTRPLVVDVLREAEKTTLFVSPRIESSSTHGTGCTLSAVIASLFSKGNTGTQPEPASCPPHSSHCCFSCRGHSSSYRVHACWYRDCIPRGAWSWSSQPPTRAHSAHHPPVSHFSSAKTYLHGAY